MMNMKTHVKTRKTLSRPARFTVTDTRDVVTRHLFHIAALALLLLLASPVHADTLKLKDGQKISGTIVGFENGMFRVETDYGFIPGPQGQGDVRSM